MEGSAVWVLLTHKYYQYDFTHLFVALYFVCIVWYSISDDRTLIASDKWRQKYAHYIVLCSLRTSGPYNEY